MSLVLKYKDKINEKIRFIEEGSTTSVLDQTTYAQNVGHKIGLLDALIILDQTLGEMAEPEDKNGIEDDENY